MQQGIRQLVISIGITLLVAGCGVESSSSSGSSPVLPDPGTGAGPSNLEYSTAAAIYMIGVAIEPNAPSVDGVVVEWRVTPALPSGLILDSSTGELFGTPVAGASRAVYTVTAVGEAEETSVEVQVEVVQPPRFAYVTNDDDTLSILSVDPATGALEHEGHVTAARGEAGMRMLAVHPEGKALYVANAESHNVSTYTIDPITGALTPGMAQPVGLEPYGVVVSPNGGYVFVTNEGSDEVSAFAVRRTGELEPLRGGGALTGDRPQGLTMTPDGEHLYVTNVGSNTISVFDVSSEGRLTPKGTPVSVPGNGPRAIAITPDGSAAYVVTADDDRVVPFRVRPDGELEPLPGTLSTGRLPSSVAVHPTGRFTYVTENAAETITTFVLGEDGQLTEVGSTSTGVEPSFVRFDPAGAFAYVLNEGTRDVSVFAVDSATGLLSDRGSFRARDPLFMDVSRGFEPVEKSAAFAYVINSGANNVTAYEVLADDTLGFTGAAPTFPNPLACATDRAGERLYVIHEGSGIVAAYDLDPTTGVPTFVNSTEILRTVLKTVAVDATGRRLLATGELDLGFGPVEQLISLDIAADGTLSLIDGVDASPNTTALALAPSGAQVVVASMGGNDVTSYSLDPHTGELAENGLPSPANGEPTDLEFSRDGRFVYMPLPAAGAFARFELDPMNGAAGPVPPALNPGGPGRACAVHPNGRFAFLAVDDAMGGMLVTVELGVDGTVIDDMVLASALDETGLPVDVVLDPNGDTLHVVFEDSDRVSSYRVDAQTGELTFLAGTSTSVRPTRIVMTRRVR